MLDLNPLHHPVCLLRPDRLTPFSAWHEHIPFAMFLIDVLQPTLIVELGTQHGDSYCAFCQAVQHLDLDTRCYAVDTWQGDEQTGFYGTEVLETLCRHHDPKYGSFSRLIQSTFDDALPHFVDGTIDLLHIDGYHTYEAVKHDFESWQPKLSDTGIVLFHDTNVREHDFGVWQFWQEVSGKYSSYEFLHGHGLGVLAPGRVRSNLLQAILNADREQITRIRDCFFQLGHKWTIYSDLQAKSIDLAHMQERLTQQTTDLAKTQEILRQRNNDISHIQDILKQRNADLAHIQNILNQQNADLANTQEILNQRNATLTVYEETLRNKDEEWLKIHEVLNQQEGRLKQLHEVLRQRDERLVELQEALRAKDEQLSLLQERLGQRDQQLTQTQDVLRQRDQQATTFQKTLQQRDQQLTQTQDVLRQRDQQAITFQNVLLQQEQQLTHAQDALRQREQQLAHLQAVAEQQREQLTAFQETSRQAESHIAHLEETLRHIYHSRGWKALSLGYGVKDRLKAAVRGKGAYWLRALGSRTRSLASTEAPLVFTCNICGARNTKPLASFGRESPNCDQCRSTVRMRSIIHVLSVELFGRCLALDEFPADKSLKGIGMSDWSGYAEPLAAKLDYQNTFYHCEPRLDICHPDPALFGTLDFIISTDVFEHVPPPVEQAFDNVRKLLKPTGVFVFSVPYKVKGDTEEHYPELYDYDIVTHGDAPVLVNHTRDGVEQRFTDLVFHGGDGATLEMRLFSQNAILAHAASCGFSAVIYADSHPSCGMMWEGPESLTMALRPNSASSP